MMADLGIAEIRAEGRKMLAKYRNSDGDSTDQAKAIELWFWGWVDELLRDPEGIDEDGIDHICAALIEVGPWDEIDGDGTEASIIADHIRDLARLRSAPSQKKPCRTCGGKGCEYGCGRCDHFPTTHRQCVSCLGSGVEPGEPDEGER